MEHVEDFACETETLDIFEDFAIFHFFHFSFCFLFFVKTCTLQMSIFVVFDQV